MTTGPLRVEIVTPATTTVLEDVIGVRFDAHDGSRGVLPGHEPARSIVAVGPIELFHADGRSTFVACERGLAAIDRVLVRIVSPWAATADSLVGLRDRVTGRGVRRAEVEAEARGLARRHEMATQRALAGLRREVER